MEPLQFEGLTVYQKALSLVDDIIAIAEEAPIGLAKLVDQADAPPGRSCSTPVRDVMKPACVTRTSFLRYAIRSAGECVAAFTVMAKYKGGHVKRCLEARDRCREVVRMLTRMVVGPPANNPD